MLVLSLFMAVQVYWFYFGHSFLLDAGITVEGVPNLNILYTTAGRLLAMIAATVFVLITQNPKQFLVVLLMSIFREGQETFIDPLFPYANAGPAAVDFGMHVVIVALEVWAFVRVYKISNSEQNTIATA